MLPDFLTKKRPCVLLQFFPLPNHAYEISTMTDKKSLLRKPFLSVLIKIRIRSL